MCHARHEVRNNLILRNDVNAMVMYNAFIIDMYETNKKTNEVCTTSLRSKSYFEAKTSCEINHLLQRPMPTMYIGTAKLVLTDSK